MRIVAILISTLLLSAFVLDVSAQVRLNELLADPASDWDGDGEVNSKTDEWVEIVNVGTSSVDLSVYRLGDASGGFTWRFGFSGTLAAGETRVVYGSEAVAWESENGFSTVGLSLNNGGDTVFLYELTATDTLIADQSGYVPHQVTDDRSTGRQPDGEGAWVVFDALNPYSGSDPPLGTGCAPTPGVRNDCTQLPVEESTWGAVKEQYSN